MTQVPWQLSYAAMADADNAELQTDVMRFMAILAFCLVAIFAIVKSLPATPRVAAAAEASAEPVVAASGPTSTAPAQAMLPAPAAVLPAPPLARPPVVVRSAPPPAATPTATAPVLVRSAPPPAATPTATAPVRLVRARPQPLRAPTPAQRTPPPAPAAAPEPEPREPPAPGLSLSFESDAVLRSLVARGLVALYAIEGGSFHRLRLEQGEPRFAVARAPAQFHEMVPATVPADIRFALRSGDPQAVTWGVTLPAGTSSQLMRFVRTDFSGSLVITADAGLALARP